MKIHFTDDEDKVFNVPRFLVRVEAENTLILRYPTFEIWKAGLVLGAGVAVGIAGGIVTATALMNLIKAVLHG